MNRTPQRLISKGELARRVTCNRSYVYRECNEGGKLYDALIGTQVNLNHPDAAHFCASHGYEEPDGAKIAQSVRQSAKPRNATSRKPPPEREDIPEEFEDVPDDITRQLLAMPLGQVVAKFGTAGYLKEYVAIVKNLVQTRGYEEEQERKRGEYIHRIHAEKLVQYIDALHLTIMTDAVRNMANRAAVQIAAGEEQAEIEAGMRSVLSRIIKNTKDEYARKLRNV